MKQIFLALFLVMLAYTAKSQTYGAMYRVQFTDKNNSPFSIDKPEEFLSKRALERRKAMNIKIDQTDIPVVQSYLNKLNSMGATVYNCSRWFNTATVFVTDTLIIPQIKALPFVSEVVKTKPYSKQNAIKEKAKIAINAANTNNTSSKIDYGKGENQAKMINIDYLHSQGYKGEGIVIAILDAGFYNVNTLAMFDSLRNDGRLLGYKDFVLPNNNLFKESTHGMSVASTIVGNMPGKLVGTAPKASVWLLRSEDANSEFIVEEDNWIAAAEFADSVGADVINSSLGYTTFDDPAQDHTYSELDGNTTRAARGADMAAAKGIIVCNSAGNSGNGYWHYIGTPADADSIICVGAVDENREIASFSSYGPSSDGQIKPTVCAQGKNTVVVSSSGNITISNGTSFSSPVMAGAVACLLQANRDKTNMQIIEAVKKSANQYNNPDTAYGYGIPNFILANMILKGNVLENPTSENSMLVSPNPFRNKIDIILFSIKELQGELTLADSFGKISKTIKKININSGYNYILLDNLENLASGLYVIRFSSDFYSESIKLIKQ